MRAEAKQLILGYAKTAGTESNIVATADLTGVEQVFIGVRGNVGTANDADETMSILVQARNYTSTDGGSTAYTTIVGTTQLAAWTLASAANAATDMSLTLSKNSAIKGAKFLQVTVNNSATGTASESWLSVVGLMPTSDVDEGYSA